MCTTDDEVCRLRNMFCKIKYIVFKIKILTVLLLCRSFSLKIVGLFISLKNPVSEHLWTVNILNVPKQCLKLHGSIFVIFSDLSERKSVRQIVF